MLVIPNILCRCSALKDVEDSSLSVSSTWWLPCKERKKSNFTVEKHDRHHLSQVIKVNINSGKSCY